MDIYAADRNDRPTAQQAKEMFRKFIVGNLRSDLAVQALTALVDANAIDWFAAHSILSEYFPETNATVDITMEDVAQYLAEIQDEFFDDFGDFMSWWNHEKQYYRSMPDITDLDELESILAAYLDEEKNDEYYEENAHDIALRIFRSRSV